MELSKIKASLENGLLSFPITDFDASGQFNAATYASRLEWFLEHDISSIFVAGGTGEFFSIDEKEYEAIVQVSVATVKEKVPVISSTGKSVREGIRLAAIAEKAAQRGCFFAFLGPFTCLTFYCSFGSKFDSSLTALAPFSEQI
jgi:5-dehydro-4-deoxyglucarate dehydratase